jgi:quinol monooxygenase YgiN
LNAPIGLSARNATGSAPTQPAQGLPLRGAAKTPATAPAVAVLLLIHTRPGAAAWGWSRVVLGRLAWRGIEGLRFARALGSGRDGGFGGQPSADRQGLFALFDDDAAADAFIDRSPVATAYREHARELLVAKLRATSCRGSWDGMRIATTRAPEACGPVAALTRAAIKPRHLLAFRRHSAPSEAGLAAAPGCRLAVGLGEAPLLRQATFSVWDDTAAMDAYARRGAHLEAIRAAQRSGYFSESMFVRFLPLSLQGEWKGRRYG